MSQTRDDQYPPMPGLDPPEGPGISVIETPTKPCTQQQFDTLSRSQLTAINKALAAIDRAVTECDKAERCGTNCDARRERLEALRQDMMAYKAEYFPGRP